MLGIVAFNVFKSINTAYPYIIAYTLICFSLFILNLFVNYDKVDVNFVNVGHGNATVITQKENAVVVDCGGDSYDGLFSVLRRRNVKRIELLALTHLDFDHTNFVSYLINNYEIGKIVYPNFCDPEKIKDILKNINAKTEVLPLNDDVCIKVLDDSELYVFIQKANEYVIKSNTSALYKFVHGQTSVCLTGDMTISQENKYLEYGSELDCDILLAAHHGSPTSSLKRILDVYTPEYSVISASEQHKYGLPDERIVKRLAEYSEVLFTYDYSNIRFTLNRKGYKITYE
jgi:competence protein ComEC